jgi:hypothetical protein
MEEAQIPKHSKDEILRAISGLNIDPHDYIKQSQNSTQDIFTYRQGGPTGRIMTNIVVTYTDTTKETFLDAYSVMTTTSTSTTTSTTTTA